MELDLASAVAEICPIVVVSRLETPVRLQAGVVIALA
jgi:hypothetical protein